MTENIYDKPATILVIDNDPNAIEVIIDIFGAPNTVLTALNGENGLEIALHEQPDIIFLSSRIYDPEALEICRNLKTQPETKEIPIIFLSDTSAPKEQVIALNGGAIDYILKPIIPEVFKARTLIQLQQKFERDQLEVISAFDALTEVPNRRRFDEYLRQEWKRAAREQYSLSLLMIDIDHFKSYNDTYGHQKGDECLKLVAKEIKIHLKRPSDLLARYGGEEFTVILPNTPSYSAFSLAKRICSGVESLLIEHSGSATLGHLTISIGVATLVPSTNSSFSSLIELADIKLYQSKNEGRNRVTG